MSEQHAVTPERIMQMAWGYAPPLIIGSAVKYGIFDLLDSGALGAADVARRAGISQRGCRILLNALVGIELLKKDSAGKYALTPESAEFLVSSKPKFQGGIFKHVDTQLMPKWLSLDEIVKTGEPARLVNAEDHGAGFFQKFVEDIFPMSWGAANALADELKIAQATGPLSVLDLATGSGVWGIALAKRSPKVKVAAVDWPEVLEVTQRVSTKHGVNKQFQFIAGDLLEVDFGKGHDVATLGHILHSEGERRSRELLKKTAGAMKPGGTIAIGEFLANEDRSGPANALIFAVNMLVNTSEGDTFNFKEISGWLSDAGFAKARTLDSPGPSPLILATKS